VSRHSARPRYRRLGAAAVALVTTVVTLLGGVGVLPDGAGAASASGSGDSASLTSLTLPSPAPSPAGTQAQAPGSTTGAASGTRDTEPPLPEGSGSGRRVVFDISDQRVWLVGGGSGDAGDVRRTYLVSGSVTDNLGPGSYAVYSRSRWATGIDDSGVMQYFVRFTRGDNAAIGFHSIPTKDGRPLQTAAQLGTPQSHGCIRQAMPDAMALWAFAPVGTKVVVTA
jgi:hypothetical protein